MIEPERKGNWGHGVAAVLAVVAVVAASTYLRIDTAFRDPNFDQERAEGMLKSDPALLYYITERIVGNGGLPPDDFRADPRVQHPEPTDLAAEFTVGQEFLVAWTYRAFGGDMPLHAFCVVLMAFVASLCALGVYGLARELTGSAWWGVAAAVLYGLLPANYRTIGFILVREDLSFPLFAIHLWLTARAVRVGSARAYLLAGGAAALALATWHAMSFFVAIEVFCLFLWFLRTGDGPFRAPAARAVLVLPVLATILVPALRTAHLLLSPAFALAFGLFAADLLRARFGPGRLRGLLAALVVGGGVVALSQATGGGSYDHVRDVLAAKLIHFGRLPVDPAVMSFDARLLWQGPFDTLDLTWGRTLLGWGAVVVLAMVPRLLATWRRGVGGGAGVLLALVLVSVPVAWLVGRTVILAGLLIPVAGAIVLSRLERRRLAVGIGVALLLLQGLSFASFLRDFSLGWYRPAGRQAEIAALVAWVDANVEPDAAITADFMNSTALLAHTGRGIVLQPKYETDRSRRRAQAFFETLFQGTPEDLRRVVRERFDCRYVLFDRYTLGATVYDEELGKWRYARFDGSTLSWVSRFVGGLRRDERAPRPGTAAAAFLSDDAEVLTGVPGFELVYRSPPTIRQADGAPYDFFRLYRVAD